MYMKVYYNPAKSWTSEADIPAIQSLISPTEAVVEMSEALGYVCVEMENDVPQAHEKMRSIYAKLTHAGYETETLYQ